MMFDEIKFYSILENLVNINSPTGYTDSMNDYILGTMSELFKHKITNSRDFYDTNNNNIYTYINGVNQNNMLVFVIHADKIGLMVKNIKPSGELSLTPIGGIDSKFLNGVFGKLITRTDKKINGTIYVTSSESKKAAITFVPDIFENNSARLKEEYGVMVGDYVFVDNIISQNISYFKSRYIDNSVSVAIALTLIDFLITNKQKPQNSLLFIFTDKEEVGNPFNFTFNDERLIGKNIDTVIALDVGDVNENVEEDEVCILAKDDYSVYDYATVNKLVNLSKQFEIDFGVDVCEGGTDVSVANSAGSNLKIASFGPTLKNMHGVEIVNKKSIINTYQLLCLYIAS